MQKYNIDYADIREQFIKFMEGLGVQPYDERDIIIDGTIHRYRVHDDKSNHKSGALCIYPEGLPAGFVQDWRRGIKVNWKYDTSGLNEDQRPYFDSEKFKKKAEAERKKADEKRKQRQMEQSDRARIYWESLQPAPENHGYLQRKKVKSYGLRYDAETHSLAVPLKDIKGQVQSIQWIPAESGKLKLFFPGAALDGAFWSIALGALTPDSEGIILLGEGCATMSKVYELTNRPCAAAMSCFRLKETAKILHEAYPKCKIVITADNDWETEQEREYNPGIRDAQAVVKQKLAVDAIYPEFSSADKGLTDWDDYALKYGDEKTGVLLQEKIAWACLSEEERTEYTAMKELEAIAIELDRHILIQPEDFIAGLFPRKRVSAVIAPPGTGKTWFLQRVVSDISVGGAIFDGFAEEEKALKSVVFAGEAGPDMMIRRAAATKWPVNKHNVKIYGMINAEKKGLSIMLDEADGRKNVERIIKLQKPDIVFFDTLGSFHNSDENKADEMKPMLRWLLTAAEVYNIAVVLMHHSRKMPSKEIGRSLTQDDVIGSSIFNRLVSVIVCIQPMNEEDEKKTLMVKSLKSWFQEFMPFTYRLTDGKDGQISMEIDLAPNNAAGVNTTKIELWAYIQKTYAAGEWFKASDLQQAMTEEITPRQIQRYLSSFIANKKLKKRGERRGIEYSVIGFYDTEQ